MVYSLFLISYSTLTHIVEQLLHHGIFFNWNCITKKHSMCFSLTLIIYTNATALFYTLNQSIAIPPRDLQSYLTLDHSHQKAGWKCFFSSPLWGWWQIPEHPLVRSIIKGFIYRPKTDVRAQTAAVHDLDHQSWQLSVLYISAVPCKNQALLHLNQ